MADKTLKIRLAVDTVEGGKLVAVIGESAKALTKLEELEKARLKLVKDQQKAYQDLQGTVESANKLLSKGAQFQEQAQTRVNAKLVEYNGIVQKAQEELRKLNNLQNATLSFESGKVTGGVATNAGYTPNAGASARAAQLQAEADLVARRLAQTEELERRQIVRHNSFLAEQEAARLQAINSFVASRAASMARAETTLNAHIDREAAAYARQQALERQQRATAFTSQLSSASSPISTGFTNVTAGMSQAGRAAAIAHTHAINDNTASLQANGHAAQETERHVRSLFLRVGEAITSYRIWNFAIQTVWSSMKAIPRIGIELDSTKASLLATIGGAAGAASALDALDKEAERTGISISVLRENFRGFQASTSLAGATLNSTWKMFTNLNTVITGLHLSTDKANGIFLAMAQIFNKGKVQSEELVKQLGNLLPGAFASFAASMGVSSQELSKQMKLGLVTAKETVENFTTYMSDRFQVSFGAASQGLNANVGRMSTAFTHLGETLYELSSGAMNTTIKSITTVTTVMTAAIKVSKEYSETLKVIGTVIETTVLVGIGALIAKFVPLSAIIGTASAALAALFAPVGMVAGATAILFTLAGITKHLLDVKGAATEANKAFTAMLHESANSKEVVPPDVKIKMDVELAPGVKAAREALEEVQKQLLGKITKEEYDSLMQRQLTRQQYLNKVREIEHERLDEASKLQSGAVEAFEVNEQIMLKAKIDALDHGTTAEEVALGARLKHQQNYRQELAAMQKIVDAPTISKDSIPEGKFQEDTYKQLLTAQMEQKKAAKETLQRFKEGENRDVAAALAIFNKKDGGARAALKEHKATIKAEYKDIANSIQDARSDIEAKLQEIDHTFQRNGGDVNAYFAEKRKLVEEDLRLQREALAEELRIAFAEKDKVKVASLQHQVNAVDRLGKIKQVDIANQEYDTKQRLRDTARNALLTTLQEKEQRILVDKTAGFYSEQQAINQLIQARKDYIAQAEKDLDIEDKLVNSDARKLELEKARKQVQAVKLEGAGAANKVLAANTPSFYTDFTKASAELTIGKEADTNKAELGSVAPYKDALAQQETINNAKLAVEQKYAEANKVVHLNMYSGIAGTAASTFEGITSAMIKMYGAQSKQAKQAFLAYKAAKIAEIAMSTAAAVMAQLAAGPYIGFVLAGMAAAMGAIQIATVIAQPMPQAHAGLDYVPENNQTYLLSKGERVLAPEQNRDLTSALKNGSIGNQSQQAPQNIRIINAVDPELFSEWATSSSGERVIMNVVRRNQAA